MLSCTAPVVGRGDVPGQAVLRLMEAPQDDAASLVPPTVAAEQETTATSPTVAPATTTDNTMSKIDPAVDDTVGRPIAVGRRPGEVAVGDGSVWTSNNFDGTMSRIDPADTTPAPETIVVGSKPRGVAAGDGAVWVANGGTAPSCGSIPHRATSWAALRGWEWTPGRPCARRGRRLGRESGRCHGAGDRAVGRAAVGTTSCAAKRRTTRCSGTRTTTTSAAGPAWRSAAAGATRRRRRAARRRARFRSGDSARAIRRPGVTKVDT